MIIGPILFLKIYVLHRHHGYIVTAVFFPAISYYLQHLAPPLQLHSTYEFSQLSDGRVGLCWHAWISLVPANRMFGGVAWGWKHVCCTKVVPPPPPPPPPPTVTKGRSPRSYSDLMDPSAHSDFIQQLVLVATLNSKATLGGSHQLPQITLHFW